MDTDIEWRTYAHADAAMWRFRGTLKQGDWRVTAEFRVRGGSEVLPQGPQEVTVAVVPRVASEVRHRGVTSGALRSAEAAVARLSQAFRELPEVKQLGDPLSEMRREAKRFPRSPRGNPDYYPALLRMFDGLTSAGVLEPVNELSTLLGLPKGTIKTQLRVARSRAAEKRQEALWPDHG